MMMITGGVIIYSEYVDFVSEHDLPTLEIF